MQARMPHHVTSQTTIPPLYKSNHMPTTLQIKPHAHHVTNQTTCRPHYKSNHNPTTLQIKPYAHHITNQTTIPPRYKSNHMPTTLQIKPQSHHVTNQTTCASAWALACPGGIWALVPALWTCLCLYLPWTHSARMRCMCANPHPPCNACPCNQHNARAAHMLHAGRAQHTLAPAADACPTVAHHTPSRSMPPARPPSRPSCLQPPIPCLLHVIPQQQALQAPQASCLLRVCPPRQAQRLLGQWWVLQLQGGCSSWQRAACCAHS